MHIFKNHHDKLDKKYYVSSCVTCLLIKITNFKVQITNLEVQHVEQRQRSITQNHDPVDCRSSFQLNNWLLLQHNMTHELVALVASRVTVYEISRDQPSHGENTTFLAAFSKRRNSMKIWMDFQKFMEM